MRKIGLKTIKTADAAGRLFTHHGVRAAARCYLRSKLIHKTKNTHTHAKVYTEVHETFPELETNERKVKRENEGENESEKGRARERENEYTGYSVLHTRRNVHRSMSFYMYTQHNTRAGVIRVITEIQIH